MTCDVVRRTVMREEPGRALVALRSTAEYGLTTTITKSQDVPREPLSAGAVPPR
jgi:hypothetical protein